MIHELRIYTCLPRKRTQTVQNMEKLMPAFERCGMRIVGLWTTLIGRYEEFIYLLEFESLADQEKKWAKLYQDPDFLKLVGTTEPTIRYQDSKILQPTAFSPLR